ncbi:fumarylacetoacetate hydrolase family protein [Streptomyces sp. NPDC006134]|uniref:fumarylacetoacetate hydrolase family protein n=1 Tax=Streptomyces sp. NPDC006134 TaxID=3154467 RepID=UPI00340C9F8C
MRLMRIGPAGQERPAVALDDRTAVDVSHLTGADIDTGFLAGDGISRLRARLAPEALTDREGTALPRVDLRHVRTGPPVARPGKIVCVGLNYRTHAAEGGMAVPDEPVLFLKTSATVNGPHDPVLIPPGSRKTDYEAELAVVIGRTARYLGPTTDPLSYVAGYTLCDDVSERAYQLERGGQWDKGKNCETFTPLGPWLVTPDELPGPQDIELRLTVNGELRQKASTADMIFPVAEIIRYVSQFMVLEPGDVITTGTPHGVALGMDPPRYLRPGDTVELTGTALGCQRHRFEAALMEETR